MQTLIRKCLIILFVLFISPVILFGQIQDQLKWEELPPLPDKEGFAGKFTPPKQKSIPLLTPAYIPAQPSPPGKEAIWVNSGIICEFELTVSIFIIQNREFSVKIIH